MITLRIKGPKMLALRASLVLACLLCIVYAVISDRKQKQLQPKGDVPAYKTPAWWGVYARGLQVRNTDDGKKLLLRLIPEDHSPAYDRNILATRGNVTVKPDPNVVYVFDIESGRFEADTNQQWTRTRQEVCSEDDEAQSVIAPFELRPDGPLFWKQQRVTTAGEKFGWCIKSPKGDIVAVRSAEPTLPRGQKYLEFFSVADGKRIGSAVKLPFGRLHYYSDCLWTCDGKFVICRDYTFDPNFPDDTCGGVY